MVEMPPPPFLPRPAPEPASTPSLLPPLAWLGGLALAAILVLAALPAQAQQPQAQQQGGNRPLTTFPQPPIAPREVTPEIPNFRDSLRDMIGALVIYARGRDPAFRVLTRHGLGLVVKSAREVRLDELAAAGLPAFERRTTLPEGAVQRRYVRDLAGVVLDGQFCGGKPLASAAFVAMLRDNGLAVLSVDHCAGGEAAATAWRTAREAGVLAHADAGDGPLARVPGGRPAGENADNISSLAQARNLLVIDGTTGYASKDDWVMALARSNHDVLVIPPFHRDATPLSRREVHDLKFKLLGARRLVLARMDLTHASDTAYYWKDGWRPGAPDWLLGPVLDRPGVHQVAFWNPAWKDIVGHTFAGLVDLGFDGVVLEGVDVYKDLEARTPLP